MKFYHVLLVTAVTFLSSADNVQSAIDSGQVQVSTEHTSLSRHPTTNDNIRSLRTVEADDDGTSEERGLEFVSKIGSYFKNNYNVSKWAAKGKSEDYVKEKLGMTGLQGERLKSHPKYKYFESFVIQEEAHRLNRWLAQNVTPYDAWLKLGFARADDLAAIKDTNDFRIYKRYVTEFDNRALHNFVAAGIPVPVSSGASNIEMIARATVLGIDKRSKFYAKMALGLDKLTEAEMVGHSNFVYYKYYLGVFEDAGKNKRTKAT
uniref:RxLR effector protein n=1 Tax=Phytophthora agathidicida TaxID=1642459 RepID=A0A7G4WHZ8_9STRA|nr:PaRXLR9 [Phytophthora agathidicida]